MSAKNLKNLQVTYYHHKEVLNRCLLIYCIIIFYGDFPGYFSKYAIINGNRFRTFGQVLQSCLGGIRTRAARVITVLRIGGHTMVIYIIQWPAHVTVVSFPFVHGWRFHNRCRFAFKTFHFQGGYYFTSKRYPHLNLSS